MDFEFEEHDKNNDERSNLIGINESDLMDFNNFN